MLLLMGRKDPQEELNLDSKLREKFPAIRPDFARSKGTYIYAIVC